MMTSKVDDPIIIIGTGRSGTTLVGNILNRHHDLLFIDEPRFFSDILFPFAHNKITRTEASQRSRIMDDGSGKEPNKFLRRVFEHYSDVFKSQEYSSFKTSVIKNIDQFLFNHHSLKPDYQELRKIYVSINQILSRHISGRWVIKQPDLSNHLFDLLHVFPEAKFIHVLRDLKDVVFSRLSNKFQNDFDTAINICTNRLQNIIEFDNTFPNVINHIYFEELIENPEFSVGHLINSISIVKSVETLNYMIQPIDIGLSHIGSGQSLTNNQLEIIKDRLIVLNQLSSNTLLQKYL